ncbi:Pyrimidodiazepine synthase [Eumeta japonica]|uniref:Pyrimidodiazepine synthase n=1 Tax=Eumeta variegata TaxID=151549 RepID=A0A4C1XUN3_EUMVA|nr:Pyrimidodiazepine synthase [Eumeta japonica]
MTGAGARLCCVFTSFTASGVRKGGVFGRRFIISQHRNMAGGAPKIDFNTKHLKKGDPLPPFAGKLRVYNMRYCPYAQRTVLALNAKRVDYEVVNINLVDKPEWLTTKSAFGMGEEEKTNGEEWGDGEGGTKEGRGGGLVGHQNSQRTQ